MESEDRDLPGRVVVAISLALLAMSSALYFLLPPPMTVDEEIGAVIAYGIMTVIIVSLVAVHRLVLYYALEALLSATLMVLLALLSPSVGTAILALTAVVLQLTLFEPFPRSLVASCAVTLTAWVLLLLHRDSGTSSLVRPFQESISPLLAGLAVSVMGSLMSRYRELAVAKVEKMSRLEHSVVELARANATFQEYAVDATEHGAETERLRITRDIHDIVGYTLTNNMMLMEAALETMQENVFSLPAMIETAKDNAEEGLTKVREAMYKLREQETTYPTGLVAITRLARVFEQATGLVIHREFGDVPVSIAYDIDSAVYHLIQESLVNSFRHGRADRADIMLWRDGSVLRVRVEDNGSGSASMSEGIGLSGMKERVKSLGGVLRVSSSSAGFVVEAEIPLEETSNE